MAAARLRPRPVYCRLPPPGVPAEPVEATILRLVLAALGNASEIVQRGDDVHLLVEVTPELLDTLALAGAAVEDEEDSDDDRCFSGEDGPESTPVVFISPARSGAVPDLRS